MLQILGAIFGLALGSMGPSPALPIEASYWTPEIHDTFIADTESNMGYIVHENGDYTMFRIGSGQQKKVHYMGITYDASTPVEHWAVKSTKIQTDRITFGESGFFMRLWRDNEETAYGIHATENIKDILASNDRYKSMGCILVSNDILDILKKTYELNGKNLDVVTVEGIWSGMKDQTTNS